MKNTSTKEKIANTIVSILQSNNIKANANVWANSVRKISVYTTKGPPYTLVATIQILNNGNVILKSNVMTIADAIISLSNPDFFDILINLINRMIEHFGSSTIKY
jgi:hypothetical protein